ncbi:MAG: NADPH:quinone oxidoreductase family protein [Deltaproteobacteria bacterium]|nr:NADPH:quinone oxidoreductase family protein [Deltaproteobacteria bacterium]
MSNANVAQLVGQRVLVTALAESADAAIAGDTLRLEPMAFPDPATLAPDDVVIRVESAAVGWVDLIMASGQYQHLVTPPYTPGIEYAGTAAWVGPAAAGTVSIGDAVIVDGLQAGPRSKGAHQRWGGFATWAVAPARALVPKPAALDFDQASSVFGNYETAYHGLITRGRLAAPDTVVIHGASGSTGLAAVQIAKRVGATVIATGRSDEKLAKVRAEGADHVINIRDAASETGVRRFRDDIKALTGGRGADVVYDGVGGAVGQESLRCLRFGGRYLVIGWASTPNVAVGRGERGAPNANQLPTNLIMMKSLEVLGCPVALATFEDPSLGPPRRKQILAWVEAGLLRPQVSHRFPLSEFRAAMRAKWQGEVVGACVLTPSG